MKTTSPRPFLLTLFAAAALLLGLAACGGGSASVAGPAGAGSFAGSTVTINPTLEFGSGNAITYTNTESGTIFPAAPVAVTGTYAYTPNADATSGTLVLTLPAPINTIQLTLQNFQVQGGNVTSFQAVYSGRSFQSSVASGTIPAKAKSGSVTLGANEKLAPAIPAGMQGTHLLNFDEETTGSPFAHKSLVTFVIGASTLQIGAPVNKTLTNPIFRNDNPYEWIFKDGSFEYAASIGEGDMLNEINLAGPGGFTPFYGQFANRK